MAADENLANLSTGYFALWSRLNRTNRKILVVLARGVKLQDIRTFPTQKEINKMLTIYDKLRSQWATVRSRPRLPATQPAETIVPGKEKSNQNVHCAESCYIRRGLVIRQHGKCRNSVDNCFSALSPEIRQRSAQAASQTVFLRKQSQSNSGHKEV